MNINLQLKLHSVVTKEASSCSLHYNRITFLCFRDHKAFYSIMISFCLPNNPMNWTGHFSYLILQLRKWRFQTLCYLSKTTQPEINQIIRSSLILQRFPLSIDMFKNPRKTNTVPARWIISFIHLFIHSFLSIPRDCYSAQNMINISVERSLHEWKGEWRKNLLSVRK